MKPKLNLVHVNVRSINRHWDELNVYLLDYIVKKDVLILTKVNIEEVLCDLFKIPGFYSHALCKTDKKEGDI